MPAPAANALLTPDSDASQHPQGGCAGGCWRYRRIGQCCDCWDQEQKAILGAPPPLPFPLPLPAHLIPVTSQCIALLGTWARPVVC